MKTASNALLILATLVLVAGITLMINGFPGSFLAIGLGTMGVIIGVILRMILRKRPEGESH